MRIEQFRYFVEVAKVGSMRSAAENLYLTQPALGKALNGLEKELGYPLFSRSHTGMALTEHGHMTLAVVTELLECADKLDFIKYQYNHTNVSDLQGQLVVETIVTLSLELLQQVLPAFSKAYPNIELVVLERNSVPAVADVFAGNCDLALIGYTEKRMGIDFPKQGYVMTSFWEEKLYALVNSTSELAGKKSLSLQQISQYPLALMAFTQDDDTVREGLFAGDPTLKIVMRSSNFELTQRHILSTNSIGLAFITSVKDPINIFLDGITIIPVSDQVTLRFSALYQADHPKQKLIKAFIETIQEII